MQSIRVLAFRGISRVAVPVCLAVSAQLLALPAVLAACGNGVVEAGEDCDDGSQNGSTNSCCTATCKLADKFPDVIVGDITTPGNYGTVGGITAYSIGTTSCNLGSCWLNWFASIPEHPVIGQNMFRLKNGRIEQIGQSWLKHGFTALTGNVCATCIPPPNGTHLGVNCSDPYVASLNGTQSNLGPKVDVNPSTGVYPYPDARINTTGNAIFKRLQVHNTDLDPALNVGAQYFIEGQYVAHDDATAARNTNNASYRAAAVGAAPGYSLTNAAGSSTQRQKAGIQAWKAADASVTETQVPVADDGLYIVAAKATSLGAGMYHYEYAVQNLTSHRSGQSFRVAYPEGSIVANVAFHDVDYHSGEPYDGSDWPFSVGSTSVLWSTQTYAVNQNANALRWGTLYNFRFDANVAPVTGAVTLGLFRPGSPASVSINTVVPGACSAVEGACGNGADDDCDGRADCIDTDCCGSSACAATDGDGDGTIAVCDCNDANAAVFPGAPQLCDGLNNNCSAPGWPAVPANELDADSDGVRVCGGDCDDTDAQRFPGNAESCDGVDNDCAGGVPAAEADADGDGSRVCAGDCDDASPARYPGLAELCDGIDNDCDNVVPVNEADADADGVRVCADDCDDADPARFPGNTESCDGIDNRCLGSVPPDELDNDGDGFRTCSGDCDDSSPLRFPGNPEVCDGFDNDCNGAVPPDEVDANGDSLLDCLTDCDPGNALVWATPGEVLHLNLTHANGMTTLAWDPPLYPGGLLSRYDTIRSQSASDFDSGAECIETDGTDTETFDSGIPEEGTVDFYLVRCENDCPAGEGPLGFALPVSLRVGRQCP